MPETPQADIVLSGFPALIHVRLPKSALPSVVPLFRGWGIDEPTRTTPDLTLAEHDDATFTVTGKWVSHPVTLREPVDAICCLIAQILKYQANETPQMFCIHAASVVTGGKALLFPATYRAGKSVLAAVMASQGSKLLGDDVIFLSPGTEEVIAPGLAPRLRTPFPAELTSAAFVTQAAGLSGSRYQYLNLEANHLASNGERAALGAIVLLQRSEDGPARLEAVSKNEALRTLIWQNFARGAATGQILDGLTRIVMSRPTQRLCYSSAQDAADILNKTFGNWIDPVLSEHHVRTTRLLEEVQSDASALIGASAYRRKADLIERRLADEIFLADEDYGRIYHLNSLSGAIWTTLSAGQSSARVAQLLIEAFPEIGPERIRSDVDRQIQLFLDLGLLIRTVAHSNSARRGKSRSRLPDG